MGTRLGKEVGGNGKRKMEEVFGGETSYKLSDLSSSWSLRYEGSTPYEPDETYETWAAVVDTRTGKATLYPTDVFHMMPRSNG